MQAAQVDQMAKERRTPAGFVCGRRRVRTSTRYIADPARECAPCKPGCRAHCKKTIDCLFVKRAVVGAYGSVRNYSKSVLRQRRSRT